VSLRIRFKPAAEHDVESAFRWYEDHRSGLGSEFLAAVDSAVSLIVSNPEIGPVVRVRVRRLVLRRFPYLLFYVIEPEEVLVLACMHASRDPERWPS
jgi:toxin ParE1/3/4